MTIETRLRRLERTAKRSARNHRCATCKDWPATLIRYADELSGDTVHPAAGPAPPAHESPPTEPQWGQCCPNCGWRPDALTIEFVDDWRRALLLSGRV